MTSPSVQQSAARQRRPHDNYPTRDQLITACLNAIPIDFTPTRILDPGAGSGGWGAAARRRWPAAHITGIEVRPITPYPTYDTWHCADFLTHPLPTGYDLIVGNPPFIGAPALVRRSLNLVRDRGLVALLLRWTFAEPCNDKPASARRDLVTPGSGLRAVLVAERVSFTEDGGTDSTTTGLFIWQRGYTGGASYGVITLEGGAAR